MFILRMGLRRRMRIEQLKSCYYAHLDVHKKEQPINKNEE